MLERAIEEIIRRHPREVFPDLDLEFVEGQRRLAGGSILDLRFRDARGAHWVLELKRARITLAAIDQLDRYLTTLRPGEPEAVIQGILVGRSVSPGVASAAAERGIQCRIVDETHLRTIAQRHGIPLDHAGPPRPRLRRTNRDRSMTPRVGATRRATSPEVLEFVRALDARFPPGSLDASADPTNLVEYWRMACPSAPGAHQTLAAELTLEVLQAVPGTAVGARSHSQSDPYTTIRAGDGRVAAALDARASFVKLDFPLPSDKAKDARARGLLTVWNPRGYSVWVQSRARPGINAEELRGLLTRGLRWEFGQISSTDSHEHLR